MVLSVSLLLCVSLSQSFALQLLMKSGTVISRRALSASSLVAPGCRCSLLGGLAVYSG